MSIQASKHVIFDVVGTLVSYTHFTNALETRFPALFSTSSSTQHPPISAPLLTMCLVEAAEREYTYLSLSSRYQPFTTLLTALWPRVLHFAGVPDPSAYAAPADIAWLLQQWEALTLREGAAECIGRLRAAGFEVWCFTAGGKERIEGYFRRAGVSEGPRVVSCDEEGVAKPVRRAYESVLERVKAVEKETRSGGDDGGDGGKMPWFAAAHMWDVSTARTVGFHGAYCTILEGEALHSVFGDMEVVAPSLVEMAEGIIAATAS